MALCRRDRRIILDKVRLCFKAEPELLDSLDEMVPGEELCFTEIRLVRILEDEAYKNVYYVYDSNDEFFGKLRFNLKLAGENGNKFDDGKRKLWIKVDNKVLYQLDRLKFIYTIKDELRLSFNNFTELELAMDVGFNLPKLIKRMLHDPNIYTILNGSVVADRKKDLSEIIYDYSGCLDHQLKYLTLYIKQKKNNRNKNKGYFIKCYNKKHEVEQVSKKHYILDYYNNPKSLFRLEITLNSEPISQYYGKNPQSLDTLFDQEELSKMYYNFLERIVRFRVGAKKAISWESIFDKSINKYPSQRKEMIS